MSESNQLTGQQSGGLATQQPRTVREWISTPSFKDEVSKALPRHCTPDRFLRVALTALTTTPKLQQCTPASVCSSLLRLSQFGLEADGRRAHLVPYGDQCQLIIDYKGLAELILRSGLVSYLHADQVCDNDTFEYNLGEVQKHSIDFKKPRGNAYAFYALCKFKDGTTKADVMTIDEVRAIQARSRAGRAGAWITDFVEMGKKTVFRRLSKWLPLSAELREVIEKDDDVIDIDSTPVGQAHNRIGDLIGSMPDAPIEDPVVADGTGHKAYSSEERAVILKEVETAMLDNGISESRVMMHVHDKKLAKEGQDAVSSLDTAVLDALRPVIPTLKKGTK